MLLTIHQPASDVLDHLDRLILLKAGRCLYQGSAAAVTDYFSSRSHPLPPKYNPADWIMIVAQTVPESELEDLGYFPSGPEDTREYEMQPVKEHEIDITGDDVENQVICHGNGDQPFRHVSTGTQIAWLMKRDFRSIVRNKMVLGARLMLTGFMSVLVGLIFWQIGGSDSADPVVRCEM